MLQLLHYWHCLSQANFQLLESNYLIITILKTDSIKDENTRWLVRQTSFSSSPTTKATHKIKHFFGHQFRRIFCAWDLDICGSCKQELVTHRAFKTFITPIQMVFKWFRCIRNILFKFVHYWFFLTRASPGGTFSRQFEQYRIST